MVTGPMARPSRPSVRLTALAHPTMTKTAKGDEKESQVRLDFLEKRDGQGGVESRIDVEPDGRHQGHQGLGHQLGPAAEPLVVLFDDLEVVVEETDEAEAQGYQDQKPDKGVVQLGPQDGGGQGGENDHQPPHGGGAGLGKVGLGAVFPDILADLHGPELADEPAPHHHGDDQGREDGEDGPEGDVPEDIEPPEDRF